MTFVMLFVTTVMLFVMRVVLFVMIMNGDCGWSWRVMVRRFGRVSVVSVGFFMIVMVMVMVICMEMIDGVCDAVCDDCDDHE